jgi:Leucine-rich repeat (LRR) protein/signal transduction histidine kinase
MNRAYFYLFYFLKIFKVFNFGKVSNFAEVRNLEVRRVRLTLLILFIGGLGSLAYAQTPTDDLWQAVKNNDILQAQEAISKGGDVNAQDEKGAPILWWAVLQGKIPLVKYLIEKGANYQAQKGSISCGNQCFYGNLTGIAAGENKLELLQYLIEELKVPVDDKEWYQEKNGFVGWTALQWSLNREFYPITSYLLKKGASLESVDKTDSDSGFERSKEALEKYLKHYYEYKYLSLTEALINPLEVYNLDLSGQQITEFPMEILQLKNIRNLNLGYNSYEYGRNNNLKEIPTQIGELKQLQELNLGGNQLTNIPIQIGELKQLRKLNLGGNKLTNLPTQIGELKQLQKLNLSGNKLTIIPNQIGELRNLTSLDLYGIQLTNLPTQIGELKQLQELNLGGNQLTNIPIQIGELKQLRKLNLGGNKLTNLPTQIGELKQLDELNLSWNGFTSLSLPTQIGELRNLTSLNLSNNELTSLPTQIGELRNLTSLNLSNNELTSLPTQIGELRNLTSLDLSNNQLTSLPTQIGELKQLKELYLISNKLTTLPSEIGELKQLVYFNLSYNPIKSIKPELFKFLIQKNYGDLDEIKKIIAEYGEKAEANRQTIERQKIEAEIRNKELEAKNLRALAERERDKNRANSLRRLAEKADLEAKLLRQQQKEQGTQAEKDRLEREALQANNRYQSRLFWVTALIALLIIGGVLAFAYVLNRSRQRQQQINTALQASESALKQQKQAVDEKNQELEALAEELRQQTDTVQAQRDDLLEKTNELEALAEELKQQNEVVESKNQLLELLQQAKDDFTGMVVHDLRNPLNPILSLSNEDARQKSPEELQKNLFLIQESGKRVEKLIDNILDIQKYENAEIPLDLANHSIHSIAQEAIQQIAFFAQQKGLSIHNQIDTGITARFDERLIERVFENFLTNAIKYTPNGGQITLTNTVEEAQVQISICDTGEGIPADKIDKIFDRFAQIEARKYGNTRSTGIGLTFCKMALIAHQSEIQVKSDIGKGAEFSFYLPLVALDKNIITPTQLIDNQVINQVELSEAEKESLLNYIHQIKQYDLAVVENYKNELEQYFPTEPNENLGFWHTQLWEAVDNLDRNRYEKLLAL